MADDQALPYVQAATLCDRVLIEDDGVVSAVRLVDKFEIIEVKPPAGTQAPADVKIVTLIQVWFLLALKGGGSKFKGTVTLSLVDPSELSREIASQAMEFGPESGANLRAQINLAPYGPSGRFWVVVDWNGRELTRSPFVITRTTQSSAEEES